MDQRVESPAADTEFSGLYERWLAAVRRQDVDTIISFYTDDVVAFDAILALRFQGKQAYGEHWQHCMEFCPLGNKEMVFEVRDLKVESNENTAFAHALVHCGFKEGDKLEASWMRMTSGLRRQGGQWKIAHEHFSSPFEMPSGKAMLHLQPGDDAQSVRAVPAGMSTITPHLVCSDARGAIEFYKKAFNAKALPHGCLEIDGIFMHGEIAIGDSVVMIAQEDERCASTAPHTLKGTPVSLHLYVQDADEALRQAVSAGAKEIMPVTEMFWGDRYGVVEDPQGHRWSLATHVKNLSPEEITQAAREFCAQWQG